MSTSLNTKNIITSHIRAPDSDQINSNKDQQTNKNFKKSHRKARIFPNFPIDLHSKHFNNFIAKS